MSDLKTPTPPPREAPVWLHAYPYLGPALLAPTALALWWREFHQWGPTLVAWGVPIAWAYLVPGVGTNILKVWEFQGGPKWGRFRPHHGFVFGSATATLAWLVHRPAGTWAQALTQAMVMACVLGFINLLYDIRALHAGILRVYNEPWARGQSAEAVALDYAPIFFGGFGAIYGLGLAGLPWCRGGYPTYFLSLLAATVAVPVGLYVRQSLARHGHWGTRPVARKVK